MVKESGGVWRKLLAIDEFGVVVALLLLCVLLTLATDRFAKPNNLLLVARQASSYGMMAVGMVLLLAMGEIDLSVGATLTLVNIVTACALRAEWPVAAAVGLGLGVGAACGCCNGLLHVVLRIPTIVVTLGTMGIYRGLALVLSKATPISDFSKDNWLFHWGSGGLFGVPTSVHVMLLVGIVGYVLLNHTAFGWRVQAIGGNPQAARFSGIPIPRYRVAAMTIMGLVAGIAGIMELGFLESGNPATGNGYELYVIAAAIIGGTSLQGGSGSVPGAILGALISAVIGNGLLLLEFSAYWGTFVTGAVIIAAVTIGRFFQRQS